MQPWALDVPASCWCSAAVIHTCLATKGFDQKLASSHGGTCGAGALSCAIAELLAAAHATSESSLTDTDSEPDKEPRPWPIQPVPSVIAVDISECALAYTNANAKRNGLQAAVSTRHSSWGERLTDLAGKCGGVVSNPPYIPTEKLSQLQPEVSKCASDLCYAVNCGPEQGSKVFSRS